MRKTKTKTPQSVVKKSKLLYNKCEINSNLSLVNNISNIVNKLKVKISYINIGKFVVKKSII